MDPTAHDAGRRIALSTSGSPAGGRGAVNRQEQHVDAGALGGICKAPTWTGEDAVDTQAQTLLNEAEKAPLPPAEHGGQGHEKERLPVRMDSSPRSVPQAGDPHAL